VIGGGIYGWGCALRLAELGVLFLVPDGEGGVWERDSLAVTAGLGVGGKELAPD
jgi:hypothetical protein